MIMLHNGMAYINLDGKIWLDETTAVDSAIWFATSDKSQIVWQHVAPRW